MRHLVIPVLLLSLMAGCSGVGLKPYRIDVQQGNVLDQESVARLKPGLSRAQVRFLLGTPLLTDPFRNDRWDYVYVLYKAGKLSEQKHISLFFDGDTLTRIEGDVPPAEQTPATPGGAPTVLPEGAPAVVSAPAAAAAQTPPVAASEAPGSEPAQPPAPATHAAVPPSQPTAPDDVGQRTPGELSLKPETDVTQIQPDETPSFPEPHSAVSASDAPVLNALDEWASAWRNRDSAAYLAAYDARFVPQGGGSRDAWAKRKQQALAAAKRIELKIESPSVQRTGEGAATVTFRQYYRSGSHHDAVVKQLRMVEHDGRWFIVGEKVLSKLPGARP